MELVSLKIFKRFQRRFGILIVFLWIRQASRDTDIYDSPHRTMLELPHASMPAASDILTGQNARWETVRVLKFSTAWTSEPWRTWSPCLHVEMFISSATLLQTVGIHLTCSKRSPPSLRLHASMKRNFAFLHRAQGGYIWICAGYSRARGLVFHIEPPRGLRSRPTQGSMWKKKPTGAWITCLSND